MAASKGISARRRTLKRAIARSLTIWSQTVDSAAEFCRALDLLQQTGARSPVAISSISAAAEAMQEIAKCVQSWHLVPIVRDGKQDGFLREFGAPMFDYIRANPHYSAVFNRAMTSYSVVETQWALAALVSEDFSQIRTLCDVGGDHGHLA